MISSILAAALREALVDGANPDQAAALIRDHLMDLSPAELETALDALVTVAAVGQTLATARVSVG